MELLSIFREFALAAGPAAVTALWQGGLLALGLGICLRLALRNSAADRFRAWAAGFAALVALPFLPWLTKLHFGAGSVQGGAAAPATRAWLDLDPRWGLAIAALWMAASMWRALDLAVHGLRLRKVWKGAGPVEAVSLGREVFATRELDRPCVIGFFRPRILIPEWLLGRLTPAELEQVVLHEAEHLRRRDDWTNLVQKLALVAFPLNPALAWMERRLCHEREMACDDAVVRATGSPRAYAACLASLAERGLERRIERRREALSLGAWRQRPELVGRVHRILKNPARLNPAAARALLAVVGCGLAFGAVEFARAPQLVAFVSPVVAQSSTPDLVNAGLRDDRGAMQGFRAVNAMAHVPSRAEMAGAQDAAIRIRRQSSPAVAKETHNGGRKNEAPNNAGNNKPGKVEGSQSADLPGFVETASVERTGSSESNAQSGQQWVVLTAWEQVVSVDRNGRLVADYDVNSAATAQGAEHTAADAAESAAAPVVVRQWTITRLILRVAPAHGNSGAGAAKTGPNSQPVQPAAVPPSDDWLVLQL